MLTVKGLKGKTFFLIDPGELIGGINRGEIGRRPA